MHLSRKLAASFLFACGCSLMGQPLTVGDSSIGYVNPLAYQLTWQQISKSFGADHQWIFDNPSGSIVDRVGSENFSIPSGMTMSQSGLWQSYTNLSAKIATNSVGSLVMSSSNTFNIGTNSGFTLEFLLSPVCARTNLTAVQGGRESYYLAAKLNDQTSFKGWLLKLSWANSEFNNGTPQLPENTNITWMTPELYANQDSTFTNYVHTYGWADITNNRPVHLVVVTTNTGGIFQAVFYVDGNRINQNYTNGGTLGNITTTNVACLFGNYTNASFYSGGVQLAASYPTALNQTQVQQLFLASRYYTYQPTVNLYSQQQFRDVNGSNFILNSVHVYYENGLYYAYGDSYTNLNYQFTNGVYTNFWNMLPRTNRVMYSSPSMLNGTWTPLGTFQTNVIDVGTYGASLRPTIIKNPNTGLYTMICNIIIRATQGGTTTNWMTEYDSPSLTGPYTFGATFSANTTTTANDTSLVTDGTNCYLFYANNSVFPNEIVVTKLANDCRSSVGTATKIITNVYYEAPEAFKTSFGWCVVYSTSEYFFTTCMTNVYYSTAGNDPIAGPWTNHGTVFGAFASGFPYGTSYAGQSASVTITADNHYLLWMDGWFHSNLQNSAVLVGELVNTGSDVFQLKSNSNIYMGSKSVFQPH